MSSTDYSTNRYLVRILGWALALVPVLVQYQYQYQYNSFAGVLIKKSELDLVDEEEEYT